MVITESERLQLKRDALCVETTISKLIARSLQFVNVVDVRWAKC
jgi:hypothetical protein